MKRICFQALRNGLVLHVVGFLFPVYGGGWGGRFFKKSNKLKNWRGVFTAQWTPPRSPWQASLEHASGNFPGDPEETANYSLKQDNQKLACFGIASYTEGCNSRQWVRWDWAATTLRTPCHPSAPALTTQLAESHAGELTYLKTLTIIKN